MPRNARALREYQREDVDGIRAAGGRALLLSTPGTGKTPIAVRVLRESPHAWPALVVAPASALTGWLRELRRWAPGVVVELLDHEPAGEALRPAHVYLTTWALLHAWRRRLLRLQLRAVVLDEVHQARHLWTRRARAAASVAADVPILLGLTGTPVVSDAEDLGAILSLWGARPPIQIRRLLEEVAPDVPPKRRSTLHVQLRPADRERYDAAAEDLESYLLQMGRAPVDVARAMRAEVFVKIGVLRRLVEEGKVWAAADYTARAVLVGEPVVLFFDTLEALRKLRRLLAALRIRSLIIQGNTSRTDRAAAVDALQNRTIPVLLCTRAGIEAITLTAARICVFVGRYWNSTDEDQAEDRLHRIGQLHEVTGVYLHAVDTLDDRLAEIVDDKAKIVAASVRSSTIESHQAATCAALLERWSAHLYRPTEATDLGLGALPAPLPAPGAVYALDFARPRWTLPAAVLWCRMHGYAGTSASPGERSIRVHLRPGGSKERRLSADIRAIVA